MIRAALIVRPFGRTEPQKSKTRRKGGLCGNLLTGIDREIADRVKGK
jgi:hypothetical protein